MFTNAAAYTNAHHLAESVDGDWQNLGSVGGTNYHPFCTLYGPNRCPDDVSASVSGALKWGFGQVFSFQI
jgi:hypothetical protein